MRVHWEESETFRELYNMRGAADSQFVRTEKALIDRKEKMLKAADLTKWGSGPFSCFKDENQMAELREKLLNEKSVALTYMLPKESQECEWKKEELNFLTN